MMVQFSGRALALVHSSTGRLLRRPRTSRVALVVAAASVLATPTGQASSDAGRLASYQLVSWKSVSANWVTTDATGCIETRTFIFALGGVRASDSPSPSTFVSLIRVMDVCSNVLLTSFEAAGTLSPGELSVTGDLTGATLRKTFATIDSLSGQSQDVTVDLTWASTSDLDTRTSSSHGQQICFGTIAVQNQLQHFREAQAAGTVSVAGTATSLDAGFGYIAGGNSIAVQGPLPEHVCAR